MTRKRLTAAAALIATMVWVTTLTACGSTEETVRSSTTAPSNSAQADLPPTSTAPLTSAPVTTAPTTAPPTAAPSTSAPPASGPPASGSEAALAFFRSTEELCRAHVARAGNNFVPSSFFANATVEGPAPGDGWIIRDGAGNRLVVNLDERVVYSPEGRDAVLPAKYSFGCPETLYLGSADA